MKKALASLCAVTLTSTLLATTASADPAPPAPPPPPPPQQVERYSGGMLGGGILMTVVGFAVGFSGLFVWGSGAAKEGDKGGPEEATAGMAMMIGGGAVFLAGIPVTVVGAMRYNRPVHPEGAARAIPRITTTGRALQATWRF